jgi:FKBP-type peptidyl-prolyl cis-trans isomerase 2
LAPGLNPIVGQQLRVTLQDGSSASVLVVAVTDTTVTIDENSPLAGKTLTFDIKLLSITPKN